MGILCHQIRSQKKLEASAQWTWEQWLQCRRLIISVFVETSGNYLCFCSANSICCLCFRCLCGENSTVPVAFLAAKKRNIPFAFQTFLSLPVWYFHLLALSLIWFQALLLHLIAEVCLFSSFHLKLFNDVLRLSPFKDELNRNRV